MDIEDDVKRYFDIYDYIVFAVMLIVSAFIGVYFAFFAKVKQNTTSEYLMGGKTMGIFPISMSLIASYISGISLLGLPAEMYTYGTQFWMAFTPEPIVSLIMAYVYLPVFYKLQITSSYEYLNLRFNNTVRLLGSTLFLTKMLLYIPIVIYVPALAFSQVTGINLHLVTPVVCIVCIFYTTLGGLKAVVWTDTVQTVIMFGALIVTVILGTIRVGGVKEVWARNFKGDRLEFFNSMSTGLNSMTGVIFEDLIKPRMKKPLTEAKASFLMKIIVVTIGSICVGLVFVVERLGTLIQASGSIGAITAGPLLGVFSLGMLFPMATPEGALAGGLISGALITWISIGTQAQMAQGLIRFPQKPISVEGCNADWVAEYLSFSLSTDARSKPVQPPFILYRISYMYYTPLGSLAAIFFGLIVSYLTGHNKDKPIDADVLSPVVHFFRKKDTQKNLHIELNNKPQNILR